MMIQDLETNPYEEYLRKQGTFNPEKSKLRGDTKALKGCHAKGGVYFVRLQRLGLKLQEKSFLLTIRDNSLTELFNSGND